MKASQRVALEMSEKREKLNALLGVDELSDEQRTEMGTLTSSGCNSSKSRLAARSWRRVKPLSRKRPSPMARMTSCAA